MLTYPLLGYEFIVKSFFIYDIMLLAVLITTHTENGKKKCIKIQQILPCL